MGASQWQPEAKFSPEGAKTAGLEWVGVSVADFDKTYKAKFKEEPSYHSAGGYVAGLILETAIKKSGATDTAKVKQVLDEMNIMTFYGPIKFGNTPKDHGLQIGHDMVYTQWQKDSAGKLINQVVWPEEAQTAKAILYFPRK